MNFNNPFNTVNVNQEIIYGVQLYDTAEGHEGGTCPETLPGDELSTQAAKTYDEQRTPCEGDLLIYRYNTANSKGQNLIHSKITRVENGLVYAEAICFMQGATGARGAAGTNGTSAGFGTPTASATKLSSTSSPTVKVSASGSSTSKVFSFTFGIPQGAKGDAGPRGYGVPTVSAEDAGKFLRVDSNGNIVAEAVPSAEGASV